jgi:hypothetical protein
MDKSKEQGPFLIFLKLGKEGRDKILKVVGTDFFNVK